MSYAKIIGRNKEINILDRIYKSKKSELVAIYGRRRVGKSYLVSECFGKKILFKAVGTYIKDGDKDYESYRQLQLAHFYDSLVIAGLSTKESKPTCWREAFLLLRKVLEGKRNRRKIIFIDELPWLAGPQSSEMIAELKVDCQLSRTRCGSLIVPGCSSTPPGAAPLAKNFAPYSSQAIAMPMAFFAIAMGL